ncbi:hypothetical protein [Streptomyces sp. NPDC048623]
MNKVVARFSPVMNEAELATVTNDRYSVEAHRSPAGHSSLDGDNDT